MLSSSQAGLATSVRMRKALYGAGYVRVTHDNLASGHTDKPPQPLRCFEAFC